MKSNLTEVSSLARKLNVQIPRELFQSEFLTECKSLQKKVVVKGFRKGKVPVDVIKSMYHQQIVSEIMDRLIRKTLTQALVTHELEMAGPPKIEFDEDLSGDEDVALTYTAEFEIYPRFEKLEYANICLKRKTIDLEAARRSFTQDLLERNAIFEPYISIKFIELGDSVQLDFEGADQDPEHALLQPTKDWMCDVGRRAFPDLEQGIIGMVKGDSRILEVKIPEDDRFQDISGRKTKLKVTITEVGKKNIPEISDAFIQSLGVHQSIEDYTKEVNAYLENTLAQINSNSFYDQIHDYLVEHNRVDLPSGLIAEVRQELTSSFVEQLTQKGATDSQIQELLTTRSEEFDKRAQNILLYQLVILALAREFKVGATQDELEAYEKHWQKRSDASRQHQHLKVDHKSHSNRAEEKKSRRTSFEFRIIERKIQQIILDKAQVIEVPSDAKP